MGYVLYWAYKDVRLAEAEIEQAIALEQNDRHQEWPYWYLGDIYRGAGLIEKPIAAYEEVLRLDPDGKQVQDILTALLKE